MTKDNSNNDNSNNDDNDLDENDPSWSDDFDRDRARNTITKLRAEKKALKAQTLTDEQRQMLDEYDLLREASRTDAERQQEQIASLSEKAGQVPTLTAEVTRLQVALDKGLDSTLAKRLQGSTREELEADADALLGLVAGSGQRQGMRPIPSQGTSGGGTGPSIDDQIVQAEKDGDTRRAVALKLSKLQTS